MTSELQKRLEEIYKTKYPRHLGKSGGMAYLRNHCKTADKLDQLEIAIDNYVKFIQAEGTEKQFIKYFSTWAREWKDWLDPDHGKCSVNNKELDLSHLGFEK